MPLLIKEQLELIQQQATKQGKTSTFLATAINFWMNHHLGIDIAANSLIDDPDVSCVIFDNKKISEFNSFLFQAGVIF